MLNFTLIIFKVQIQLSIKCNFHGYGGVTWLLITTKAFAPKFIGSATWKLCFQSRLLRIICPIKLTTLASFLMASVKICLGKSLFQTGICIGNNCTSVNHLIHFSLILSKISSFMCVHLFLIRSLSHASHPSPHFSSLLHSFSFIFLFLLAFLLLLLFFGGWVSGKSS